jgi:hypothetical protein
VSIKLLLASQAYETPAVIAAFLTEKQNTSDATGNCCAKTDPAVHGDGVPIFLLNDTKFADDYVDLWDGTIDLPLNVNDAGDIVTGNVPAWTGTSFNGSSLHQGSEELGGESTTEHYTLGDAFAKVGQSGVTSRSWVDGVVFGTGVARPLYAMSGTLTVPESGSFMLISIGAIGLIGVGRRRRKRAA